MRGRRVGLILALLVLVAACGAEEVPGQVGGQGNPRAPVQDQLRERGRLLLAGDVAGYLGPLSPEARAFEEPIATRAVALGFTKIDLTVGSATISDDGTRFKDAAVTFRYNWPGLPDDNPFRLELEYDLERRGDVWEVTRSAFSDLPPLWATGEVAVTDSAHAVTIARPGTPDVARTVELAEVAFERLLPKLTLEADPKFLLVVAADETQVLALAGEEAAGAVGLAIVRYISAGGSSIRPEGRHAIVDQSLLLSEREVPLEDSGSADAPSRVLEHELAHLALSRFTRPCTSAWVAEGGAMLLADQRLVPDWRAAVRSGALAELVLNPPDEMSPISYGLANAAVLTLVERSGAETFFDFYQNFKSLPECMAGVDNVRAALDERLLRRWYKLGVTRADLLAVEELEGYAREYIERAVAAG